MWLPASKAKVGEDESHVGAGEGGGAPGEGACDGVTAADRPALGCAGVGETFTPTAVDEAQAAVHIRTTSAAGQRLMLIERRVRIVGYRTRG